MEICKGGALDDLLIGMVVMMMGFMVLVLLAWHAICGNWAHEVFSELEIGFTEAQIKAVIFQVLSVCRIVIFAICLFILSSGTCVFANNQRYPS